ASLLAASGCGWRIALIEANPFLSAGIPASYAAPFDARSTALSYGSVEILRELGLWEQLQQHATPIRQVHVSDRGHLSRSEEHTRLNSSHVKISYAVFCLKKKNE